MQVGKLEFVFVGARAQVGIRLVRSAVFDCVGACENAVARVACGRTRDYAHGKGSARRVFRFGASCYCAGDFFCSACRSKAAESDLLTVLDEACSLVR